MSDNKIVTIWTFILVAALTITSIVYADSDREFGGHAATQRSSVFGS
jgi:hypothetical protein